MFKELFFVVLFSPLFTQAVMKLTSSAFAHNTQIPAKYTCEGLNISPALQWINPPKNAKSFVLIVDDPDAPTKNWVHWIVFNIPTGTYVLEENFNKFNQNNTFVTGATDFEGIQKWGGPCPTNNNHRYHFTLYALNTMLDLPAGATKEELLKAMNGHILDQATLIGMYGEKEEEKNKDKKETDKKPEVAKDQEKGSEDKEQSNKDNKATNKDKEVSDKDKEVVNKDKEATDKDKEGSKKDTETVNKDRATKEADQNNNKESENKNKANKEGEQNKDKETENKDKA